jgi:myo-inositol catabolism protein IolC
MTEQAERLSRLLLTQQPFIYCVPCLGLELGLEEKQVRDAAQFLVVKGFTIGRAVCHGCGIRGEILAPRDETDGS